MHVQVVNAICATIVAIGLLLISTRLLQLASLSMEASRNPLRAGVLNGKASEAEAKAKMKPKKSICRACPNAKRLRDECIVQHGQDACTKWVEAHLRCLRAEGFKVYTMPFIMKGTFSDYWLLPCYSGIMSHVTCMLLSILFGLNNVYCKPEFTRSGINNA